MGLDMYLSKRHYVQNWDFMQPKEKHQITVKKGGKKHPFINPEKITYITENVGYWRKANAIHAWFVDNVQEGNDDCREYYVETEKLKELLELCKKVKESTVLIDAKIQNGYTFNEQGNKVYDYVDGKVLADTSVAEELLPSKDGFFFGGTEYDQYYMEDIENTIKILENEFSIEYPKGFYEPDYYYRASW